MSKLYLYTVRGRIQLSFKKFSLKEKQKQAERDGRGQQSELAEGREVECGDPLRPVDRSAAKTYHQQEGKAGTRPTQKNQV